jgi:hypothetical protein
MSALQARANVLMAGSLALQALEDNPACNALFNPEGIPQIPDPANVLSNILNGTGFATIAYQYMPVAPPSLNPNGDLQYEIVNATTTNPLDANGYPTITINTNSLSSFGYTTGLGTFNIQDAAVTLLHELGHVYDALWGQNSTTIQNDSGFGNPLSPVNTANVRQACF